MKAGLKPASPLPADTWHRMHSARMRPACTSTHYKMHAMQQMPRDDAGCSPQMAPCACSRVLRLMPEDGSRTTWAARCLLCRTRIKIQTQQPWTDTCSSEPSEDALSRSHSSVVGPAAAANTLLLPWVTPAACCHVPWASSPVRSAPAWWWSSRSHVTSSAPP